MELTETYKHAMLRETGITEKGEPMATLQELREQALLSRAELAKLCGVSHQAIYYWEHGESAPRIDHIRKLVEALHKTPEEIRASLKETQERAEKQDWAA